MPACVWLRCCSTFGVCACALALVFPDPLLEQNERCVSALHLDTLNKQRAMLLVQSFMAGRTEDMRPEWVSTKVMCAVLQCVRLSHCVVLRATGVEVAPHVRFVALSRGFPACICHDVCAPSCSEHLPYLISNSHPPTYPQSSRNQA